MADPMKHADYVKAITEVAGVLYWLATHEPQPPERRGVLRRLRAILDAFLGPEPEPEEPPEMPARTVEFFVQGSNGEDAWIHHPQRFSSEVGARRWAHEGCYRWSRIQRVETSYTLVERSEEK